jgi:hypothetical protein
LPRDRNVSERQGTPADDSFWSRWPEFPEDEIGRKLADALAGWRTAKDPRELRRALLAVLETLDQNV